VELDDYLDAITRESARLAESAGHAGLDASVPSCPEWTVADLVEHIANVQRWARITVETRATQRIAWRELPPPPPPNEVLAWFRDQTHSLVETLARTDPATPVWSWTDDHTARFWFRRQANEVAVHRWDAQGAAGTGTAIDTALAADGIDEWLAMLPFRTPGPVTGSGETLHLHCTDTPTGVGGEWLVTLTAEGPVTERVHAKGDVAARGGASELDLFVWGRVPVTDLEVFGDADLLARFQAETRA
jgi:uncharacterized protein (TIGR03083 family)